MSAGRYKWRFGLACVTAIIPAFAFALAGIAKWHDPFLAARFLANSLSLSLDAAYTLTRFLASVELILAVALCFLLNRSRIPAVLGVCLLAFFVGVLTRLAWAYPSVSKCGCFGSLMGERLSRLPWVQVKITLTAGRRSAPDLPGSEPAPAATSAPETTRP